MNEDQGRLEQSSSCRIKLFKEMNRQGSVDSSDLARGKRAEWDRRQSVRTQLAVPEKSDESIAS